MVSQRKNRLTRSRWRLNPSYRRARTRASLRAGLAAATLVAALAASGCAAVVPLPSMLSSDDTTGSIPRAVSPLSSSLDAEDWRRARAALAVALDPQGNGAPVTWDNPRSGAKGVFTPVGDARPSDDKICRAFLADVGGAAPSQNLQGLACRDKTGDWAITDVKPWRKA